ncbi:MAG TPA: hypothetical protein VKA60_25335 [Blastocatellia bacterium]|nr:hypothetical protein [Blastocatellia bacterium]
MLRCQYRYLHELLPDYDLPEKRFYNHIMQSNIRQCRQHPEGSPVPWRTIRKDLPGAISHRLKSLLKIGGYWPDHCRVYQVHEEHLLEYTGISARLSAEEHLSEPYVCFETGRLMNTPPQSRLTSDSNHKLPPIPRAAIEVLSRNGCFANLPGIDSVMRMREVEYEAACARPVCAPLERERLKGRLINDRSCRDSFYSYRPVQYSGDIYFYRPAWKVVSTGRLHVGGGCMQSASGEMKRRAYEIEGVENYDIVSSQIFITITLLQQVGLDASWLIDYYDLHNYEWYGEQAGIPGKLFKHIVIALCMGAHLPTVGQLARIERSSILKILGAVAEDEQHLASLVRDLREVVGDLAAVLKDWHRHLLDHYIPANRVKGYLPNAVGMNINLTELNLDQPRYRSEGISRVAAHLLQGLEAVCIQEMIARSDEANFMPISCEHDGFIVSSGKADMSLWSEITAGHGLGGMKLVQKAL